MHVIGSKGFLALWALAVVAGLGCGSEEGGASPVPATLGETRQEVIEWTGSLQSARSDHTATLLPDGRVLVAGGETATSTLSSAQLYNPATGTWTATGSMNASRAQHRAVLLNDGRVLVMGGYTSSSSTPLATAEIYNPATGTWTLTGSLNQRRRYHGAVKLTNGKVLAVGGLYNLNDTYLASAEMYDPATGTWTFTSAGLGASRMNPTALLLLDGRVAVMGGQAYSGVTDVSTQVELFNPSTGTFSSGGVLSSRRHFAGFIVLPNGRVLAAGGNASPGTAEIYDPVSQTSQPTSPLVQGRFAFALTALDSTRILAVGGSSTSGDLASVEVFDTTTSTWSTLGALHTARSYHTATLLNGTPLRVLVAAGFSGGSGRLTSVEVIKDGPDDTAPVCTLLTPSAGATVRQSYTLSARASDSVGVTSVEFLLDGVLIGTATQPFPTSDPSYYSLTWSTTSAANGAHTVTARARDAAGFATSASANVTVDNDYTPPTVSLISPTTGASLTLTTTLTASAADNVGVARVEFYRGTTLLGSDAYAPYSLSWDTTLVANGAYTLTAKAFDTAGNVTESASVAVTVANESVPPTVALTAPTESSVLAGIVTVTADATDNVGVTQVTFYRGSTVIATDTTAPYSVTWDTRNVANGSYVLTAKAQDATRNATTSVAVNVTVSNDSTPPVTSVTAPAAGVLLSGSVTLTASASDNVAVARVEFYRDSTLLGSDDTAPYSVTWDTLGTANASYTLTSKAFDPTGNATISAGVSVTVSNAGAGGPLVNGGFEGSSSPWALFGQAAHFANAPLPHGGSGYVELGRINSATSSIEQLITVPASAPSLSFWMYITTTETTTSVQNDQLFVEVLSSSGTLLGTLATYSNLNRGTQYTLRSFSLSAYAGQLVRLRFRAVNNGTLATTFRLDDVAVQ
jgi:hypothetical protein